MKLTRLTLSGFKSISEELPADISFGDTTILLGANGVGKSNLVSFFKLLNAISRGHLQNHIGEQGSIDSLLYHGKKVTQRIKAFIRFEEEQGGNFLCYEISLIPAAGDRLIFEKEDFGTERTGLNFEKESIWEFGHETSLVTGGNESDIPDLLAHKNTPEEKRILGMTLQRLLQNCKTYHFHDTTSLSPIRSKGYIEDNRILRHDGGNLAAILYSLKNHPPSFPYYQRIVMTIQHIMPQFGDFSLQPDPLNERYITLNWTENSNREFLFGPHQISDGSLRFMALATLLLQHEGSLPGVIILDEPELGLHPSAIAYLAGMIKTASAHSQVIIATQSPRLVDEFDLENILIVERNSETQSSQFSYKDPETYKDWMEQYSLSELWEKNVIGGQP